jgi:hypothetical protein
VREIRSLRAMWRALETGSSLKIYAPALDPTEVSSLRRQPIRGACAFTQVAVPNFFGCRLRLTVLTEHIRSPRCERCWTACPKVFARYSR